MFTYQEIIRSAQWKFAGFAWLSYDIDFRRKAAGNLSFHWGERDTQLYLMKFTGQAKSCCSICGSGDHYSYGCLPVGSSPQVAPSCNGLSISLEGTATLGILFLSTKNSGRTFLCGNVSLTSGTGLAFFFPPSLSPPPKFTFLRMLPVPLAMGVSSITYGSRVDGSRPISSTLPQA